MRLSEVILRGEAAAAAMEMAKVVAVVAAAAVY